MSEILLGKIDIKKVDQSKWVKGEKGTYMDIVVIPTPTNEYNDFMIVQGVSKEDREAGIKGPIIGNASYTKKSTNTKSGGAPKGWPEGAKW